jgi:biofilm PGA synthesis N-glycosyltransferase PgaC
MLTYAVITPAKNEECFIEETIRSMVCQTATPIKWVVVSDGSTDSTDKIVRRYVARHSWMELLRVPERANRDFAGKVHAFNAGYAAVRALNYDIIGSLDADISFEPGFFEYLLNQFTRYPELGVAGTPFKERGIQYNYLFSRKEHVSGACQLFRRECFESIGGYVALKEGAIDLVAVVASRMKGWKTQTFTEMTCVHHRPMGSANHNPLMAAFKSGYGDYRMGVHPLWQFFRSVYQMSRRPVILGGGSLLLGYLWALFARARKPVSSEFVVFRRREQMLWLRAYWRRTLRSCR